MIGIKVKAKKLMSQGEIIRLGAFDLGDDAIAAFRHQVGDVIATGNTAANRARRDRPGAQPVDRRLRTDSICLSFSYDFSDGLCADFRIQVET